MALHAYRSVVDADGFLAQPAGSEGGSMFDQQPGSADSINITAGLCVHTTWE